MRVLFYSDVLGFGGHEVTVLEAVAGAVAVPGITVAMAYNAGNRVFHDRLDTVLRTTPGVNALPHAFSHASGDLLRAFLPSSKRRAMTRYFRRWSPDWLIVCQGHMGVSTCALSAAVRSGARVASFVPMAHTLRQMSGRGTPSVAVVDALLARAYAWPDAFLTISAAIREQLQDAHGIGSDRIRVIEYGPDLSALKTIPKQDARSRLGLDAGFWMGLVGRVEFAQKGHDVVFEALARHIDRLGDARLLVAGEGPDLCRARATVARLGLESRVRFIPWTNSPAAVYSALDLLLLPSRYEGVPIVMMEAMYLSLPVVASDIDGTRDLLPAEWRFSCGSSAALADAVSRVRCEMDPGVIERHRNYIARDRNSATFRAQVGRWIASLCAERVSGVRT